MHITSPPKPAGALRCAFVGIAMLSALAGCGGDSDSVTGTSTSKTAAWQTTSAQASKPTANPYLASPLYAITHFDPSQSDSTPYGPPEGVYTVDPSIQAIVYGGPVNIMTLASTDSNYMWSVGSDHVAYVNRSSDQWAKVASIDAPAYLVSTLGSVSEQVFKAFGTLNPSSMSLSAMNTLLTQLFGERYSARMANGAYSVVDKDNVVYANFGNGIYAFALADPSGPSKGISIARKIDDVLAMQTNPPSTARVFGLSMTYDGNLIVVFNNGVAIVNRNLDLASSTFYAFNSDETVSNSIAVDENNGIYVASDKLMRKLVWTGKALSDKEADGAWSSPYDAPTDAKPPVIKLGLGTGSTPTLMGFGDDTDRLVVITDGAKRMKLVAFWRDTIPAGFVQQGGSASRRIAGQIQVTAGFSELPEWIQSEQSVVVNGYGAFVVNNIPSNTTGLSAVSDNKVLVVTMMGPAFDTAYGVERFQWDAASHQWSSVWARSDVSSTSMIPVHSQSKNMALVNGYTPERGWEVTGMNWNTGETVHQTIFGKQNYGNGAYAILEYLENGDLIFNSIVGPFRVHYHTDGNS